MFTIIGIVVVFGAVLAGYLMEHGNLKVLMQPAELVIIGGAAIGTVLIANPLHILKEMVGGLGAAFGGTKFNKQRYLETLKMMYELFGRARKDGLMALETDSDVGSEPDPVQLPHTLFSLVDDFRRLVRYNLKTINLI
jgi:chemotaxis protein MotA